MAASPAERETVSEVVGWLDEDLKSHDIWADKVDRWYRAWRGVHDEARTVNSARDGLYPRYILQIIETLVGGVMDPNPKWRVKARQRMASLDQLEEIRNGAKSLEILLAAQRDQANMVELMRPHRLQGLIAGMTVWKTYWTLEERMVKRTQKVTKRDEEDGWPRIVEEEIEVLEPYADDPGLEVVDVRDWIPHEAARSMESMLRCHHKVRCTWDQLKELEKIKVYKNIDQLKETDRGMNDSAREETLFSADRTKDTIEVVEHWIEGGRRVVTTANRSVLLADRENPFEHGKFPFIACGPIPDLFRLQGVSVVEIVEDLQEMLWELQNQRHLNLDFLNNLILKVREGSTFGTPVFAPGEVWMMDDPTSVEPLTLPTFPAEVTLQAEGLIKADIQNIPGASPALLGQSESTEQTATEISLLTNLAQRRLASQKHQFTLADKKVAEQWIELNKQFLTEERYIATVGADGEEGWELIHPSDFASHEWKVEVDQMDESMLRQERLAEAQSRYQLALTGALPMAQAGMPLNFKAFMEDVLEAAGMQDTQRYFSNKQQLQNAAPMQPPAAPGPGGPGGVTNPQAAAGPQAPSNEASMSPVAAMQRMGAMNGGPSNV